jgi:hypothetical protein
LVPPPVRTEVTFSLVYRFIEIFSKKTPSITQGCKENAEDGGIETTSTIFSDVDLSDKEWSDYDEKSGEATVISEFEVNFVTVKD